MTMVFLANVPSIQTPWGIECFTPHAHVSIDYPCEQQPCYAVISHFGALASRRFAQFADAMDYASLLIKQSEPA